MYVIELLGLLTRLGIIELQQCDISKIFDRIWHASLLPKVKSYGISGQKLGLILFSVIDGFKCFWMRNFYKNIKLILKLLKAPFLVQHYFYHTLKTFFLILSVVLPSANLYSKCNQASDLWQQQDLASVLESDLQDTGLGQKVAC